MRDPHGWAWSSAPGEIRARRPTDGALLIASTVLLGLVLQTRFGGGGPSAAVQSLLRSLSVLGHVWRALIITGIVASAGVIVMAVIDRRWGLCRDLAVGALGAALLMFVLHHMSATPPRLAIDGVFPRGAKAWPVLRLSLASGLFAVAAPSLVRPLRYTAHVVLGAMAAATIALSGTNVNGVLIALCAGWIAASTVHLAVGSPGGRPSLDRVATDLAQLGLQVTELRPAPLAADGIAQFEGINRTARPESGKDHRVVIKVFGRDAWNGQLFAAVWRFLTYRGPGSAVYLTRLQHGEHEALVSMIAARGGAPAPQPLLVSKVPTGDVVLVAVPAADQPLATATAADVGGLWALVDRLHEAGAVHRAIAAPALGRTDTGELGFIDVSQAVLATDDRSRLVDDAQMFAATMVLAGRAPAVEALFARGADEVAAMLRYLQPAVMPTSLGTDLTAAEIDLADVRQQIADRAGDEVPQLEKIRRVTRSTLILTAIIVIAAWFLISTFSNLDWGEVREALIDANWWWLIFAFVMAQAPRIGGSLSMIGACKTPLPYGPVVLLQYALPFIDVAAPAAAGRIAATMRFQQRYGVSAGAAFSASIIDSGAGFAAQLLLLGITFVFTDLNLSALGADRFDIDLRVLLLIVIAIAAVISLLLAIPAIRRRVSGPVRDLWGALSVLKSPAKFALLLGGSMLTEMLYAVAMALCLRSLGLALPYASVLVVTCFVRFVSGVSPIPGGLGIAEAGLTAGLVAAGIPVELAFPAALIYRLCTFYVPPTYGWAVLGMLRKREYL